MDDSEDHFVYDEDDIIDCASDAETDDMHPDVQMTANEFEELFGNSDSEFEGLVTITHFVCFLYTVFGLRTIKNRLIICFSYAISYLYRYF